MTALPNSPVIQNNSSRTDVRSDTCGSGDGDGDREDFGDGSSKCSEWEGNDDGDGAGSSGLCFCSSSVWFSSSSSDGGFNDPNPAPKKVLHLDVHSAFMPKRGSN